MKLKNGGGNICGDSAVNGVVDRLSLVCAVSDEHDLACVHDSLHAEGDRIFRNSHGVSAEEACVRLAGSHGDLLLVGERIDGSAGLVEADVAVSADSEKLEVDSAGCDDLLIVLCCGSLIEVASVAGKIGVGNVDVNMLKRLSFMK